MGKSNDWFSLSEQVEDIKYTTLSRIIYQTYCTATQSQKKKRYKAVKLPIFK